MDVEFNSEMAYMPSTDLPVMSERVQIMAASIYREFEKLISTYDENVVKELTPLVVTVLESLEQSLQERQERDVELELLREDNEQLLTQYEREKQLRRNSESKYLGLEDSLEEKKAQSVAKIESLESILRMFELRMKNAQEQILRLEEKDENNKKEFARLHERYTDLLRAHSDYKDRMQILMATDSTTNVSSKRLSKYLHHRGDHQSIVSGFSETLLTPQPLPEGPALAYQMPLVQNVASIQHELQKTFESSSANLVEMKEKHTSTQIFSLRDCSTETADDLNYVEGDQELLNANSSVNSGVPSTSLHDEICTQDREALNQLDVGADIVDSNDDEEEDDEIGMSREVENLIKENHELLETKNALNVVKDDLIAKVDELSSEKDVLREEITSLEVVRDKLRLRVTELEEEVRRVREELLQQINASQPLEDDESGVTAAQRKRFTRAEMARVLMERNQYKERLMELQEAIRWTEMHRAMQQESPEAKKRSSIVTFFSSLFRKSSVPNATIQYRAKSSVSGSSESLNRRGSAKVVQFREDQIVENEARKAFRNEERRWLDAESRDDPSRLQANGWLLPVKFHSLSAENVTTASVKPLAQRLAVPVPICSRPISQDADVQIWCAAAINLNGCKSTFDGAMFNGVPGIALTSKNSPVEYRPTPIEGAGDGVSSNALPLSSSLLWVGTAVRGGSEVMIFNANCLHKVLAKFYVSSSHVLCIAGVSGTSEDDFLFTDAISCSLPTLSPTDACRREFGTVSLVQFREATVGEIRSENNTTGDFSPSSPRLDNNSPIDTCQNTVERASSSLPTMWLGTQSGRVYIHSTVSNVQHRLHCMKLSDSVVDIVHIRGRVVIALANGTLVVFCRASDLKWNVSSYYSVTIGEPYKSVRSLCVVANERVWCGYQNKIHLLNPETLSIEKSFDAHPRQDSQVRQMAWVGDGVWVSIRLDSTLRLYHARTCQHLQDIDVEPHVSKLLGTGNVGFSFVRISCLMVSCNRLWIGTSSGVVMSVPLFESNQQTVTSPSIGRPGGVVRVYGSNVEPSTTAPAGLIPYCNISQAQLSYHGLKDAVKFLVAVPGLPVPVHNDTMNSENYTKNVDEEKCSSSLASGSSDLPSSSSLTTSSTPSLVAPSVSSSQNTVVIVTGGEGYVDFRTGGPEAVETSASSTSRADYTLPRSSRPERGHLLAWQFVTS